MLGNYSITANFAVKQYSLTTSSTDHGNVSTPGEPGPYTYDCGTVQNIIADPDTCYHFVNWSGTGVDAGKVSDPGASSTTITIDANYSVQANFAINTYTLTYTAGANGTINGTSPQTVNCGASGSAVTAVPNACYHFVNWSDASTQNPRTDTNVQANITVTANFASSEPFYLNVSVNGNGSVTAPGTGTFGPYNCSAVVNLSAAPDLGYEFVSWSGDTATIANPYSPSTNITMNGNYSITANFGLPPTGFYGDANRDGVLNLSDYSTVQLMRFGRRPIIDKYEVSYDFLSGADSNKWAMIKTIPSIPPGNNFDAESGWTAAGPTDYANIATTDANVWTISGTAGNYSALQCKFTIVNNPTNITSIGVTLNGSSSINGSILRFYAWNFSASSWTQIGTGLSTNTSISSYPAWAAWGKVYANYIDGSQHMFILAALNTTSANLNIDHIKLSVAYP